VSPERHGAAGALAVLVALLAGCPGAGGHDRVVDDGDRSPGYPKDFVPAGPLGEPAAVDPDALGADYLTAVHAGFRPGWTAFLEDCRLRLPPRHQLNRAALAARIAISVDRTGRVVATTLETSSGVKAFDQAALEVVREAGTLPAPPAEVLSDDDRAHLHWLFARDARQAGPATAAVRRVEWPLDRAVPKLIGRGRVGEAALRVAAALESGRGPSDALVAHFRAICAGAIGRAIAGPDPAVQVAAIETAAAARLGNLADAVREQARRSAEPEVRRAALRALSSFGDRATAREVALGTSANSPEDRGAAAAALVALGGVGEVQAAALAGLGSTDESARWSALVVMAHVPVPAAVPELRRMLGGSSKAARAERMAAALALGTAATGSGVELAKNALSPLIDCLAVSDAAQRAACAHGLALAAKHGARSRPAYSKVVALLRDRDEQVRAAAALSAARLDPQRFGRDMAALAREKSEPVLASLAEGLAGVPAPEALARLVKLVSSESPQVRLAAVSALAARADARSIMAGLIDHSDLMVRATAIRVDRRVDVLRAQLAADSPEVRAAALSALVAVEGSVKLVPEAARLLAQTGDDKAECARLARAWLAP
jgi:TonB family protein